MAHAILVYGGQRELSEAGIRIMLVETALRQLPEGWAKTYCKAVLQFRRYAPPPLPGHPAISSFDFSLDGFGPTLIEAEQLKFLYLLLP